MEIKTEHTLERTEYERKVWMALAILSAVGNLIMLIIK